MICQHCNEPLRFVLGKGWVHENGQLYVMKCKACGKLRTVYGKHVACVCGCESWVDDHCALAIVGEGVADA